MNFSKSDDFRNNVTEWAWGQEIGTKKMADCEDFWEKASTAIQDIS